jgi:hypothetical protein
MFIYALSDWKSKCVCVCVCVYVRAHACTRNTVQIKNNTGVLHFLQISIYTTAKA